MQVSYPTVNAMQDLNETALNLTFCSCILNKEREVGAEENGCCYENQCDEVSV
jgi:hypothetical protein